jgi:hypothetical protein
MQAYIHGTKGGQTVEIASCSLPFVLTHLCVCLYALDSMVTITDLIFEQECALKLHAALHVVSF